jgi:hypothetical protein
MWLFMVPLVVSSLEMNPGWGLFHLDWPPAVFYAIVGVTSAAAGFIGIEEYRIPGLVAGPVAGVGALLASSMLLSNVESTSNIVIVFAELIGALPGIGLFYVLKAIQDRTRSGSQSSGL